MHAEFDAAGRCGRVTGKGVHDAVEWSVGRVAFEFGNHVGFGLATVHHERQVVVPGQLHVPPKHLGLLLNRRVVPVTIQAGFTDRDDPGCGDQFEDGLPVGLGRFGDIVGLDADDGVDGCEAVSQFDGGPAGGSGDADGGQPDESLLECPIHDLLEIIDEGLLVEMAMGIEEPHGAGLSSVGRERSEIFESPLFLGNRVGQQPVGRGVFAAGGGGFLERFDDRLLVGDQARVEALERDEMQVGVLGRETTKLDRGTAIPEQFDQPGDLELLSSTKQFQGC